LNIHIGIFSSNHKIAPLKFFDAFSNIVSLFEKSKFNKSFQEENRCQPSLQGVSPLRRERSEMSEAEKSLSKKANPLAAPA